MKSARINEIVKGVSVVAYRKDFDGDLREWQEAYFQMLSWKNTWGLVFDMDVLANRNNGVFVRIVLSNEGNLEHLLDYMKEYGYRNIKTFSANVAVCELPENCDFIVEE